MKGEQEKDKKSEIDNWLMSDKRDDGGNSEWVGDREASRIIMWELGERIQILKCMRKRKRVNRRVERKTKIEREELAWERERNKA